MNEPADGVNETAAPVNKPGPKGIDWDAEREKYVTGKESLRDIAARLKVGKKAVEAQAARDHNDGKTWGEMRAAWRAETAEKSADRAGDAVANRLARVRSKAGEVAEMALDELLKRLRAGGVQRKAVFAGHTTEYTDPIDDKDLVMAAKLAVAVKLEMGGDPDGVPLQIAANLDQLSLDELRRLAGEA